MSASSLTTCLWPPVQKKPVLPVDILACAAKPHPWRVCDFGCLSWHVVFMPNIILVDGKHPAHHARTTVTFPSICIFFFQPSSAMPLYGLFTLVKCQNESLKTKCVTENLKPNGFIRQMAYCKTQKKCHEIQFSPGLFKLTLPE